MIDLTHPSGSLGWRAVEGTDMDRLILSGIALALVILAFTVAHAQDPNDLMRNIEGALKERDPDWVCKKSPSGEPGPDSPHGTNYNFVCTRDQQSVMATIFLGDSKEDAVKLLELSQWGLQINTSKPQEGIGEQAYAYSGHGFAWVTFRKANVFAQVSVSLIDPRKVPGPSPEIDALTNQAWEIAKRLALNLAQQTGATQNKSSNQSEGSTLNR
jgi:hypothetical protein